MAEANVLEISTNGHVRVLRLNRPQRKNALSAQLGWSIVQAIEDAAAGLNGVAVGAGLSLAMATDIRLASSSARLMAGYARMGTSPDGGLTWTLAQLIGYERALRFLLEMPMMPASEALERGLVGEVVDAGRFEERFSEYLTQLAALPPIAVRQTKRALHRATAPPDVKAHAAYELVNARRGLASEAGAEALKAFMERRPAQYRGR